MRPEMLLTIMSMLLRITLDDLLSDPGLIEPRKKFANEISIFTLIVFLPLLIIIYLLYDNHIISDYSMPFILCGFLFVYVIFFILTLEKYREIAEKKKGELTNIEEEGKRKEEERRKKLLSNRQYLHSLTGREFEHAVAEILEANGYSVKLTRAVADLGADIIAYKNDRKYVVEVKRYSEGTKVGTPELQKLQGAMLHYKADAMIFVTLSFFTSQAQSYAKQNGIELIDGNELLSMAENVDFEG